MSPPQTLGKTPAIKKGLTLFTLVAVWCIAVVLPVNLTGGALDDLLELSTGASAHGGAANSSTGGHSGADAPPPEIKVSASRPVEVKFGPGQTFDAVASAVANDTYVFSSLDRLSMANVPPGDARLWVHLASTYVVAGVAMRLLWRYSTEAVELRYAYLAAAAPGGGGAAGRAVLVTDIPGVSEGTLWARVARAARGAFGWLVPAAARRRAKAAWRRAFAGGRAAGGGGDGGSGSGVEASGGGGGGMSSSGSGLAVSGSRGGDTVTEAVAATATAAAAEQRRLEKALSSGSEATAAAEPEAAGSASEELAEQQQQEQQQQQAERRRPRSAAAAAAAAARLRLAGRLGLGRPRRHDEWRRARERLAAGLGVRELVEEEFKEVYGASTVAAVVPAHSGAALEAAVGGYARARRVLEDLLDRAAALQARAEAAAGAREAALARAAAAAEEQGAGAGSAARGEARRRQRAAERAAAACRVAEPVKRLHNTVPLSWAFQEYGAGMRTVPLLQYRLDQLRAAHRRLLEARAAALRRPPPSAFVVFAARWPAVVAATALHTHDEGCWRVRAAPSPDEVLWRALGLRVWERAARRLLAAAALVALALFYVVPVAALQGLLQVNGEGEGGGVTWLCSISATAWAPTTRRKTNPPTYTTNSSRS